MASPLTGRLSPPDLREAAPWVRALARMGYAAKGIVYLLVGGLALQAAQGTAQTPEGSSDALTVVREQPFGRALLAVLALGLVGYVVWRLVQAVLDPEGKGSDAKGWAKRAGYALSALLYGALALEAVQLFRGAGGGNGGDGAALWTDRALDVPFGRWLVALVGAGVVGYGLYELYRAWAVDIAKRLDLSSLSPDARTWTVRFGRAGLAARGVVFVVIGWFLARAALATDAGEARGLGGALDALREQPYGPWLLGAVAVGLLAYGLFQLAEARYRRIQPA